MWKIKDSKQVEENEHIRFRCMRCAACCRHVKGTVVTESLDVYRLARHLGMETADFISQYTDPFILDERLWYPIFSLRTTGNEDSCVFLKGSRCTVQEAKPRTCRLYPFWVEPNGPDGASFAYHFCFERRHHPKGSLIRVRDWMNEHFWKEDQEFLKEEYQAIQEMAPLIHSARAHGMDDKIVYRELLLYRYLFFDTDEPFLPQLHRNNRELVANFKRKVQS